MEIHNERHRHRVCVRHQGERLVVQEKLNGEVRALVLLGVYQQMHLDLSLIHI